MKKIWLYVLLLGTPYLFSLIKKSFFRPEGLYSDTVFVMPESYKKGIGFVGEYTNDKSPEVIDHLDKYCVYEQGSVSAPPSSYYRFCTIREGAYEQKCGGDGYNKATCSRPKIISKKEAKKCQEKFIAQRFYPEDEESNPAAFFSNCAQGEYPEKTWRDEAWVSKLYHYDGGEEELMKDNAGFSLTRTYGKK